MPFSQRLHAACAGLARGPFALPGTERQYERPRPFRIEHLALDLTVLLSERAVEGTATVTFERVSHRAPALKLDALGFDLRGVELMAPKKTRAPHEYDGETLTVAIPEAVNRGRVRIRYRVQPKRGLYFLAPDAEVPDRPLQVWSQCQDEDARCWLPCHDKPHAKMTLDLTARVPAGMRVLSNGECTHEETPRGKRRPWVFRYEMREPVPSYLVTLVVGTFEVVTDRPARRAGMPPVPIDYWIPPGRQGDAKRSFGETPRMVELFGKLTGVPYPWPRYSQVVVSDFIFGGMENTTATTMYEHVLLDEKAAVDVTSNDLVAHELAHHWFGDFVTCRDWSHAWLNEGFATFFEHVEREDRLGRDEYEYGVAGDLQSYLSEAGGRYQRPIVCRDYEAPIDLFDRHLYQKGGLVLHMLRRHLGDDVFWRGVQRYLDEHAHGIVETNDLQRALERESGESLEQLFDQWVYRPGHPVLDVRVGWEDGHVVVGVKQKQPGDAATVFAFVLEIAVADASGDVSRHTKVVTSRDDSLVVAMPRRPAWVAFDPDFRVAASVSLKAPADLLETQLRKGETARIRWSAAAALAERDDASTLRALGRSLARKREAWMVRAEAARSLGKRGSDDAEAALTRHVLDPHPKVRRAVVSALGEFKTREAARVLAEIAERDDSYLVEAEACRSLGRTRDAGARAVLERVVDEPSWADAKRAGALDGLASLRDDSVVDLLTERTRYGVPSRGRRAAIAGLARVAEGRRVRQHLEDLLEDRDPHLRITVVGALTTLGDAKARGALRRRLDRERDGRVARRIREALSSLGDGGRADQKRLTDEVEQLRRQVTELSTRLGKLEGKRPHRRRKAAAKDG